MWLFNSIVSFYLLASVIRFQNNEVEKVVDENKHSGHKRNLKFLKLLKFFQLMFIKCLF